MNPRVALPYGPMLQRILRPLQRAFLPVNRWVVGPMLRSPLWPFVGNPFTSYILLLRTTGRRSRAVREAPLGYVIRDGFVYCVAGYGMHTPWFLNLVVNPSVEVRLPGRTLRCRADVVQDDAEWLGAHRALIASFGLVGRLVDGDVRELDDAMLLATHRVLPVVRMTAIDPPGPIVAGAWDPGGRAWLALYGAAFAVLAGVLAGRRSVTAVCQRRAPFRFGLGRLS